jgi:mannose/fructose/N-acetylgalactosamine-specific phosphotransferase system component IIC
MASLSSNAASDWSNEGFTVASGSRILEAMWIALRRYTNYFLVGFVVAFLIYLFVRYDADEIIVGIVISACVGILLCLVIFILERRFPEQTDLGAPH